MSASPPSPPRVVSTRQALIALTVAVAIGHWLALGGEVPLWPSSTVKHSSAERDAPLNAQNTQPQRTSPGSAAPLQPERAVPEVISTVRWITPPPPPPPPNPKPSTPVIKKAPPPESPPAQPDTAFVASPTPEPDLLPAPEPVPVPVPAPVPVPVSMETDTNKSVTGDAQEEPLAKAPSQTPSVVASATQVSTPLQEESTNSKDTVSDAATANPAPRAASLPPALLPPNGTLSYNVAAKSKGLNYTASGTLTWRQNGSAYQAESKVSVFLLGSIAQTSTGQVTPEGLAPDRFTDRKKAAHFERTTSRIRYSSNAPDAPLLPGAQDQLSVTIQLGGLLNADAKLTQGTWAHIPVSSTGASEVWHFEIGPLETLHLPAGDVIARRLTRGPRHQYDKTIQLWLAPSLGHLPVRTRLTERNGDFFDQLLDDLPAITLPATTQPAAQQAAPS